MRSLWKSWIGRAVVVAALASLLGMLFTVPASAADRLTPPADITLKDLQISDLKAQGVYPIVEIWFPGYGDYQVDDGNYLYIEYNHSDLARPEDSTMTAYLNGVPVGATRLGPESVQKTGWKVALPRDLLARDLNHVELHYAMQIPGATGWTDCSRLDNPALWATVYQSSYIHYEYSKPLHFLGLPEPDLARFPQPFIRSTMPGGALTFVLPDGASQSDFTAAASVAARFGQAAGGKPLSTTLLFASQVDQSVLSSSDLVVIGRPDANSFLQQLSTSLPLKLAQVGDRLAYTDQNGEAIDPSSGIIQEFRSPWDERFTVLVVSGGNDTGVQRATRTMSSRLAMKVLQGPYAIVSASSEQLTKAQESGSSGATVAITLQEIGVGDLTISKIGTNTTNFSFDAPPVGAQDDAYLQLVLSHSTLIDPVLSSLTVALNGVPIQSIQLKSDEAQRSVHRIILPRDSFRPGRNTVTLTTSMYAPPSNTPCSSGADERAWAVIHADSAFVLPVGVDTAALDLSNLPYPFLRGGGPSGTYLVLPADGTGLQNSLRVAVELGRLCLGDSTELQAGQAGQLTQDEQHEFNLVLYGTAEDNSAIDQIGPSLPLDLSGGTKQLAQRPDLMLLGVKDVGKLGVLELIHSPQDPSKAVLVVSGTTDEMAESAPLALSGKLPPGSAAVITLDEKGDRQIRALGLGGGVVQTVVPESALRRRMLTLAAYPVIVVIAAMVMVMLVRVIRRQRS